MLNELEIIKSIVSELSGAGLWFGLVYIGYLFVSKIVLVAALVWLVKHISNIFYKLKKPRITREEANIILDNLDKDKARMEKEKSEMKMEVEKVKHQYMILKESMEGDEK